MKYLIPFLFIILPTLSKAQNIGVGTIEPKAKLHVAGQLRTDSSLVLDTIALPAGDFINVPKEAGFVKVTDQFGYQANQMMMNGISKVGQVLFVHNEDDDSVFFHEKIITPRSTSLFINEGMSWLQITDKNASNILSDANGDTRVLVEKRPNEDKIRFEIGGDSVFTIDKYENQLPTLSFNNNPILVGINSGKRFRNNVLSSKSIVVGNNSLINSRGEYHTCFGTDALQLIENERDNNAFGVSAGQNLKGSQNTVIGGAAGRYIIGDHNIAVGYMSLRLGPSNRSIAMGNYAGSRCSLNVNNVFVGHQTAFISDSIKNSVLLGFRAGHMSGGNHNIFIGDSSGLNSNNQFGNIFIGQKSGLRNIIGGYNTYLGNLTGVGMTNGDHNTIIGYKSSAPGQYNDHNTLVGYSTIAPGMLNTFIGSEAGKNLQQAHSTIAMGYRVLASRADTVLNSVFLGNRVAEQGGGEENVFMGYMSGTHNKGKFNTFLGSQSGRVGANANSGCTGENLVLIGYKSGYNAGGSYNNVLIGSEAASSNLISDDNVIIGNRTGKNAEFLSKSNFLGAQAGFNSEGIGNNFIGFKAGYQNTTGSQNLFIGTQSGENNTTASHNIALGYRSAYTNETGGSNITIGTDAMFRNLSGSRNIAIGDSAGFNNRSTVGKNIFIGHGAGKNELGKNKLIIENSSSNDALIVGDFKDDYLSFGGSLYSELIRPKVDNTYDLGQSYFRWRAVYALNGTIQTSDVRQKKNIENLNYGLNEVMAMRSVSYEWKHDTIGETKVGFIAQELEQIVPEVVVVGNDSLQTRGVNYAELIPVLVNAIQEQQQIITDLEKENETKRADLNAVNNRLSALEQKLNLLVGDLVNE